MTTRLKQVKSGLDPRDYSVLICDDDQSIRTLLSTAVREWGFQVAVVASGEEALRYFEDHGAPDVLLTDINMGGMSGVELAREVKTGAPRVEIIIMTAQASFESAVQAMRIGVFDYLCKPFDDLDNIRHTLIHVCGRIYDRLRNEYLVKELEHKNREIDALATMSKELAENRDLKKVISIGCEGLSRAFGGCPVAFFQYLPSQNAVMASVRHPAHLFGGARPSRLIPERWTGNIASLTEYFNDINRDPVLLEQISSARDSRSDFSGRSTEDGWRSVAFNTRDIPRGFFLLHVSHWRGQDSTDLLNRYMRSLAIAFENGMLHAQLLESSIMDDLTGLINVRHMKERLDFEIRRVLRLTHPISLLFIDVDHFKCYNDTNGHPAGDAILRTLGRLLSRSFRRSDLCARYGGEEFCVIMPDTVLSGAIAKAESFRAEVEAFAFPREENQPGGRLTISIGIAEIPTHADCPQILLAAADAALYEAKRTRNSIAVGKAPEGHTPLYRSRPIERVFTPDPDEESELEPTLPQTGTP